MCETRLSNTAAQTDVRIIYEDRHVVVVDKPAGMSTVTWSPEGSSRPSRDLSLDVITKRLIKGTSGRPPQLGIVQRLDRGTSGVVVFAKTRTAERHLSLQFRSRSVSRLYLALAAGRVSSKTIRSHLIADRGDRRRGSSRKAEGKLAITHVAVMEHLRGATLICCKLGTGRTHQIRIHMAEDGHPLLGEMVYGAKRDTGAPLGKGRIALHAATLSFTHPETQERMTFESPVPEDFQHLAKKLGGSEIQIPRGFPGPSDSDSKSPQGANSRVR